jgi:hypothetical protein
MAWVRLGVGMPDLMPRGWRLWSVLPHQPRPIPEGVGRYRLESREAGEGTKWSCLLRPAARSLILPRPRVGALMRRFAATLLLLILAQAVDGRTIVVDTGTLRLLLDHTGFTEGLLDERSGTELVSRDHTPFASVRLGTKWFPVTSLTPDRGLVRADFSAARMAATLRFSSHGSAIEVSVVDLTGPADELRFVQLTTRITQNIGRLLNVSWDDGFATCVMALSDRVHAAVDPQHETLTASAVREFGIEGAGAAIIAAPTPRFLAAVEQVEREFGLPCPTLGGRWAKQSREIRSGYLFTDLTEDDVDEVVRLAKLAGFGAILTSSWSSSSGSYPINLKSFPHGEEGVRAVVDKCHAAGLRVGMHTDTSLVGKRDPLVTPRPDPRLLKDGDATLAADIDPGASVIRATESVDGFSHDLSRPGLTGRGRTIQIDDEIIAYGGIGGANGDTFTQCRRGFAGTHATAHRAGAKILHLCERDGFYLADLRTPLKDQIAERIAGVYNRCGFDMIYFDGGELNDADGPAWYWVSQQQIAVFRRITRDVLVEGSGITQWLWHILARGNCDDYAVAATKRYFEYHKVADDWAFLTRNFLPADLGWVGIVPWAPDHQATTPDEIEYYAARAVAFGAPLSVESTQSDLHKNGRVPEMLTLLGRYQRLSDEAPAPAELQERLRSGEWRLTPRDGRLVLVPVNYEAVTTDVPGSIQLDNPFGVQALSFRLEAEPAPGLTNDAGNISLLPEGSEPIPLGPPHTPVTPGELAARLELGSPPSATVNLLGHRALAVDLEVEGAPTPVGKPTPVLNVQLESVDGAFRDYDINLNWRGYAVVVVPEPTTERVLPELRPAPSTYNFKYAMTDFSYGKVGAVNFRWMRSVAGTPLKCRVIWLKALGERPDPVVSPTLSVGTTRFTIPTAIAAGDYAEYAGSGPVVIYDKNGAKLMEIPPEGEPLVLHHGANVVTIETRGTGRVRFTGITSGKPLSIGAQASGPPAGNPGNGHS